MLFVFFCSSGCPFEFFHAKGAQGLLEEENRALVLEYLVTETQAAHMLLASSKEAMECSDTVRCVCVCVYMALCNHTSSL